MPPGHPQAWPHRLAVFSSTSDRSFRAQYFRTLGNEIRIRSPLCLVECEGREAVNNASL